MLLKKKWLKAEVKLNDPLLAHYSWIVVSHAPCNIWKTSSKSLKADNMNFVIYLILNIISMFFREQMLKGF